MKHKVSVIMPVLNGRRYIAEAIQSIVAQTYRPVELVVVDDGSTDDTRPVVDGFRDAIEIKYVTHQTSRGIPVSMNDGIRNSTGSLISFLDHDDAWFPAFLETQWAHLEAHSDVGMVHADFQTTDPAGAILEESVAKCRNRVRPSGHVFKQLFLDSFIVGNSVLIRKECFDKLGLFDERFKWGDYHMWLRIARHYKVDYVPQVLTQYRQHPTQSTRSAVETHPYNDLVQIKVLTHILELYPEVRNELGQATVDRRFADLYVQHAHAWWKQGNLSHARACLSKAIGLDSSNHRLYALYASTFLGQSGAKKLSSAVRSLGQVLRPERAR